MIKQGHFEPVWTLDEIAAIDYQPQPESLRSDFMKMWISQGYYHKSFCGDLYGQGKTVPAWCHDLADHIGLTQTGFTFHRMNTLDIMPTHQDHFINYCKIYQVNKADVHRALVFLDDWRPGHYFEYADQGLTNWRSGDWIRWSHEVPHAAANIGVVPRYTLQITGVLLHGEESSHTNN